VRIDLPAPRTFADMMETTFGVTLKTPPRGIATDNREVKPGDLFLALPGENVDGHQFVPSAAQSGAVAALVTHTVEAESTCQQIAVDSVTQAIGTLAQQWRRQFSIPVVGITGSNGKTTTKELLKHYFSHSGRPHATSGNYNTSIGLPLTLLTLEKDHTVSLLEMGANQPGDIQYLTQIAEPTHGLITNIAPAHLEGFGSIEGILKEKANLLTFEDLTLAFQNVSDPFCSQLEVTVPKKTYGFDVPADFTATDPALNGNQSGIMINGHFIPLPSPNPALKKNVLAAVAVALTLGIDWSVVEEATPLFTPVKGRCVVQELNGLTIIDDTYNANVESTQAALGFLTDFSGRGRKIFVFGDMFEMGSAAEEAHAHVGRACLDSKLDAVFTTGQFAEIVTRIASARFPSFHFRTKERLLEQLRRFCQPGDVLLVKGSRGMAMETIIQGLETT